MELAKTSTSSKDAPSPVKKWFCVAMSPSGNILKVDTDSPAEFLPMLQQSVICWVDYVIDDFEGPSASAMGETFGFSNRLISSLVPDSPINYQDFDTEIGMKFPCIQVRGLDVTRYPLLILMRKNLVFTMHQTTVDRRFIRIRRYSDTFVRKIPLDAPPENKLTALLIRIIEGNNDSNFGHLREIEDKGDELNSDLMSLSTPRDMLAPKIYAMKHAIITYLDGLWHTVDVLQALRYGDAVLVADDIALLDKVSALSNSVSAQIGLAEHMSEVLASGLEVLQTIYNNQLQTVNNRLSLSITYLTIIGTAFLVPNTLATIMGSSAFELGPEDKTWYIALLVASTILATALAYFWVKRSGWLPKKPDSLPDTKD
jgi:magnesium transporter